MALNRAKSRAAITLVEVMVTVVIVALAVLGASGYRYYLALDARKAALERTGVRVALLLSESWRGQGFDLIPTYDPTVCSASDVKIAASVTGPDYPLGFTPLGRYEVVVNGDYRYWASLSWKDYEGGTGLRVLNTVVAWFPRSVGAEVRGVGLDGAKSFKLTTYVSE